MAPIARYTVLRLLVFFGCVCVLWLFHMRGIWLLIVAALVSTAISFVALNRFREETVRAVDSHLRTRQERAREMREAEDLDDE